MSKLNFIRMPLIAMALCLAAQARADAGFATAPYRLSISTDTFKVAKPDPHSTATAAEPTIPAVLQGRPYAALIQKAALKAELEPALVHAVISVESGYNHAARSSKGAIGLMQLMPDTANRYGVRDPAKSPEANLRAGTFYLRDLMRQFGDRLDLVLAAYNAGENAVVRYGHRIPPYAETRTYVPAVLEKYREWREPPTAVPPVPQFEYISGTRLESLHTQNIAQ